jgi:chloramphenicol 3-O phosphotransferase
VTAAPGWIVVLNGPPRSGKSSIARAIQETLPGIWMNLGVDVARLATPPALQPGIGLRPGEPEHPAAAAQPLLYAALYESIAAHSRLGLNVAVDAGHHDGALLADCARRLDGLPALLVGVRCPLQVIMERRRQSGMLPAEGVEPVERWQRAVHVPGIYDLELDTSALSPAECAAAIADRLAGGPPPAAFRQLASS